MIFFGTEARRAIFSHKQKFLMLAAPRPPLFADSLHESTILCAIFRGSGGGREKKRA